MDDTLFDDPFGTQSVTPPMSSMQTKGTAKLLVVIFIVDCSMTMKGDRIGAVNAALQELKYILKEIKEDNGLDMRVAVMSFTSSAKWDRGLTPVEELNLGDIQVRPGLTEYGTAFHELNKVLRKDRFMQHTGKIAPPAIMFLTDGEPTDDYQSDLDELLKNGWFVNASRSAVLLGDAIYNASAKEAVRQFVDDPETEIVAAEDSTVIMQKLKIATMHTVAGVPIMDDRQKGGSAGTSGAQADPSGQTGQGGKDDPFGTGSQGGNNDPFGQTGQGGKDDPFGTGSQGGNNDPFGQTGQGGNNDPFGQTGQGGNNDPFGQTGQGGNNDPFGAGGQGGSDDPSGQSGQGGNNDPFGAGGQGGSNDPFGAGGQGGSDDPFGAGGQGGTDDPFGAGSQGGTDDPFGAGSQGGDPDPFGSSGPGDDDVFDSTNMFDGDNDDPF